MAECSPPNANVAFESPALNASPCNFTVKIPFPQFTLALPAIPFPPLPFPIFNLSLSLSCSLDNPIDVSGGIAFGGGRVACFDVDPDEEDQ